MELLLLAPLAFATSAISGALGMGGGLILMAVLALALEPGPALVLHGVLQLAANGHRAWLLREHARLRIPALQLVAALPALGLAAALGLVVERRAMLAALGAMALLGSLLSSPSRPRLPLPAAERTPGALLSGALLAVTNVTAGVSGPLLDLFFIESRLDRFGVVATKALCASVGHVTKMAYVLLVFPPGATSALSPGLLALSIPCVLAGTVLGRRVLTALDDTRFRNLTRACLGLLGLVYLARAWLA